VQLRGLGRARLKMSIGIMEGVATATVCERTGATAGYFIFYRTIVSTALLAAHSARH